jgi:D-3-phosphoglycerate dehydrogenase
MTNLRQSPNKTAPIKCRVAIGPSSFSEQDTSPLDILEGVGIEVIPNPFSRKLSEEEIINLLTDVDGLIAGLEPLNRHVLTSATRLRAIARVGINTSNVDLEAAAELNIRVSNTPDSPTEAVAEMTLAALLALCRELFTVNTSMHMGHWIKKIGLGLAGTKVLLIGHGRIGRRVGELLKAFNADILVYDPFLSDSGSVSIGRRVSLEEGLAVADVVSLHAGGTETILGEPELEIVQSGVILLNSARGELIDEPALLTAIDSGKVAKAWLDVYWQEPYEGELKNYPQVIMTTHMSTYTKQCRRAMEVEAVNNLITDLEYIT